MALASATTSTLKKDTFTFTGNLEGSGADKFVYFLQYVVGSGGSAMTLSVSFIKESISTTTTFVSSPTDTATVAQQVFTITGSKNVAVPVTVPLNATSIVAVVSADGAAGTLVIDGYPDIQNA